MHIIRFQLTPDQRKALPVGVGVWLLPVARTMDRISSEAARGR